MNRLRKILWTGLLSIALAAPAFASLADETSLESRNLSVLKVDGEQAFVNRSGGKELPAFDGMVLGQGDCVTTGMDTGVYIQADRDKTVKMDQNTMVEITKVSSKKLKMTLKSGELFFHVENHLSDDETMEFDAAGTTLSIRGTAGLLGCHGDQVSLYLLEGTVEWTVNGRPVTITAGQKMTAKVTGRNAAAASGAGASQEDGSAEDGQTSGFTADELNAFELETMLENQGSVEIPASVGLTAEGVAARLEGRALNLRNVERERGVAMAATMENVLTSQPQTEPGSGAYDIIEDEGGDDDSYPLSEAPEAAEEPEEPERPKIDFRVSCSMGLYEACLVVNNVTNVLEGETPLVRIMVFPSGEAVPFGNAREFMEFDGGSNIVINDCVPNSLVDILDELIAHDLIYGNYIDIYVTVYTAEEQQHGYSGCKLEKILNKKVWYGA